MVAQVVFGEFAFFNYKALSHAVDDNFVLAEEVREKVVSSQIILLAEGSTHEDPSAGILRVLSE